MQTQIRRKQPLAESETVPEHISKRNLNGVHVIVTSLKHVSLEERRRQANQPLYLVRYE
jgi:hypothetical protein